MRQMCHALYRFSQLDRAMVQRQTRTVSDVVDLTVSGAAGVRCPVIGAGQDGERESEQD